MTDKAHSDIEAKIKRMEKRLLKIYKGTATEIERLAKEYFEKFEKEDEKKRKQLEDGEITKGEYAHWRRGKILYGKRFKALQEDIAELIAHVNETAIAYINNQIPELYSLSYNALEGQVTGVGGYSFTLVNQDTVKELATTDKNLLPKKKLDQKKDKKWNMRNVNQSVLRSIYLGESIPKMAKRLRTIEQMNVVQSVRAARTLATTAENKGRQDSYFRAQNDGIILEKFWMATDDRRTRKAHNEAGERYKEENSIPVDEPFIVGGEKMMYPGDSSLGAKGHNIYNCRCTMGTVIKGFRKVVKNDGDEN